MNSGVQWSVRGIRPAARESAKEAARRSGMSLSEWLNQVIIHSAAQSGVDPDEIDAFEQPNGEDIAAVNQRLDDLTRKIEKLGRSGPHAYAPPQYRADFDPQAELIGRLDRRMDQHAAPPLQPAAGWSSGLDQAVAEIAARRRALNGEPTPQIPQAAPQPAPQPTPQQAAQTRTAARAVPAPQPQHPPAQDLSGLEDRLRQITNQIETLRTPGVEEAINALRGELAEIGNALNDAMPRQAIDHIERQIQGLSQRIAEGRQAGVDGGALGNIEHGLAEVRDALHHLTPAENLIGFNEAVAGLAHKIDLIVAQKDPQTLEQLEGAITTLRQIAGNVASNEAVDKLAGDVAMLSEKIDRLANSGAAGDILTGLEQRISALSEALAARSQSGGAVPPQLERLVNSLSNKIEQVQLSRGDHAAVGHLEDRIVKLVEKLDASDSRLGHLEAIERGLADLLVHIERNPKGDNGLRANGGGVDALKSDIARTQNEIEAVHGTLGEVVARLAKIEHGIRADRTAPENSLKIPLGKVAARLVGAEPPPAEAQPASPASPVPTPPAPPDALSSSSAPPPARRPPPLVTKARPINPDLPPDEPIEPGSLTGQLRDTGARIAASQAALGPEPADKPTGKTGFLAAARRAAKTALAQEPATRVPTLAEFEDAGAAPQHRSMRERLMRKVKTLFIAASVIAIVVGGIHLATPYFRFASAPTSSKVVKKDAASEKQVAAAPKRTATAPAVAERAAPQPQLPGLAPPSGSFGYPTLGAQTPSAGTLPETALRSVPQLAPDLNDVTGSLSQRRGPSARPSAPQQPKLIDTIPIAIGGSTLRHAAAAGDPTAAYEIGARFAEGRGIAANAEDAARWFERAAEGGLAPAQFRLGSMYEKGQGVRKDTEKARQLYMAAASKGNAKAMHNLAVLYAEGINARPDYASAVQWFRKAAAHGISDSQYNLAILCGRGLGMAKNFEESYKWFALAAAQGDKEAVKKRDDLASRLDPKALAAAQHAVQTWKAEPQPDVAVRVPAPEGGWDPAPTTSAPSAAPRTRTSGYYELGKR